MSEAAAQFKKQDGRLAVSTDGRTVSWKASSGSSVLDIAVAEIGSMFHQTLPFSHLLPSNGPLTTDAYRSPADASYSCESLH
jgi:hypothetical protein